MSFMTSSVPNPNLRINHPCPYLLSRMKKDGENYFCQGCSKTIIDFRGKSYEEIKCIANKDTCGIFTLDQLPSQQKMKFTRQIIFYGLAVISFFGFTVRPLKAQNKQVNNAIKDTISV